jgi:hypothetical protein
MIDEPAPPREVREGGEASPARPEYDIEYRIFKPVVRLEYSDSSQWFLRLLMMLFGISNRKH